MTQSSPSGVDGDLGDLDSPELHSKSKGFKSLSAMPSKRRKQKERKKTDRLKSMRERFKRCFYCKCELVYYPLKKGEKTPDNYATIEHLNSRYGYPNGRPKTWGKARSLVVACYKCNWERGEKERENIPLEELWERSGSPPLGETCQRCIGPNPVWFAPNELWNKYAGDYNFLCPNCFIELADDYVWKVSPEADDPVSDLVVKSRKPRKTHTKSAKDTPQNTNSKERQ